MIRKEKENIIWLEFEILEGQPGLKHAIFLRHGGVSKESYSSLNLHGMGDSLENVSENKRRIRNIFQVEQLICVKQVHAAHIAVIRENQYPTASTIADGMITDRHNWGLLIGHADCQAAIFYDPIRRVIANVHAGWRGQVKNIYQETILKMQQIFHTNPKDLLVAISPSLGPENAEFKRYQQELPETFWPFQIKPTYFDLWAIARHQLEASGVLAEHIQIAEIDTYSHPDDCFSYRREKAAGRQERITGAHGTVVALKKS